MNVRDAEADPFPSAQFHRRRHGMDSQSGRKGSSSSLDTYLSILSFVDDEDVRG